MPGTGCQVSGISYLAPGTGFGLTPRAEHRAPKTELGHRKTRTPSMQMFSWERPADRPCRQLGDLPEAMGRKARGRLSASRFGESRVCGIMPPAWDGSENEVEREKTVIKWEVLEEREYGRPPNGVLRGGLDSPMGPWTKRLLSLSFLCRVSAAEPAQGFAGPGGRERLRGVPTHLGPALT